MKYDTLSNSIKRMQKYDPKYGDKKYCQCGHHYIHHFNPETKQPWGCFFSYNCDCEEFKPVLK